MNNAEEATKIAKEARWATLGRALADAARTGKAHAPLVEQAITLRAIEQAQADKQTQFAALARQIGDAAKAGRSTADLLHAPVMLRQNELGRPIRQS